MPRHLYCHLVNEEELPAKRRLSFHIPSGFARDVQQKRVGYRFYFTEHINF